MGRGRPRPEETDVPDIRETLAQLDRRLADLRHQINDLVTEPDPAPPPPPPPRSSVPPPPQAAELEREYAGQSARGVSSLGPQPAQVRAVSEAVGQLGAQVKELLTMRERLLNDAERLLAGYERRIRELEALDPTDVEAALAALASPPEITETAATVADAPSRPAFFDGLMMVSVVGVGRIQTVQVLEDSLSRVRNVERVYIRRWHAGRLLLELTLSGGVELLGELNRVLPFSFAVHSATGQDITISLEGER